MTIPTESRIFADRYFREARRVEALSASRISPGARTWGEAMQALFARMKRAGSPRKMAHLIRAAGTVLSSQPADLNICLGRSGTSRSAALLFLTLKHGGHPLGVDEDGVKVQLHAVSCRRRGGARLISGMTVAYVSRHAVARLHERSEDPNNTSASAAFAHIGALGFITRDSRHIGGGLHLHLGDALAAGSLRPASSSEDARALNTTFLDIRTVLQASEVKDRAKVEQGIAARVAVERWLRDRDPDRMDALAEGIPQLPGREDYPIRALEQGAR